GDAQMLFDLDLALDQSEKNPVYKVQYAHARMSSIFRKAGIDPAGISADGVDLGLLTQPAEQDIIKQLGLFPEVVERAADARAPHMIAEFLDATAGMVNSWWVASPWTASKRPSAERTRRLVVRRSTSVPRPRCSRPCSSSAWSAATTRSTRSTSWSSAAST